jgi:hypothetical protein
MAKRIMIEEFASWQKPVLAIANSGTATKGFRYIVGAAPTGTFEGLASKDIAWYDGTAWQTDTPSEGWKLYDLDQNTYLTFDGTNWVADGDLSEKMDKVDGGVDGNLVSLDENGNAEDSGVSKPVYDADLGCILMDFAE